MSKVRDITGRKATEQTQAVLALHDPLFEQALNRRLLVDDIDLVLVQATCTGASVAVLYRDLGRFKQVNDEGGHDAGDELRKHMAYRLRAVMRPRWLRPVWSPDVSPTRRPPRCG